MSLTFALILCLTVLVGAFIQGASGIGFALIFAPVAGFIDPTLLPITLLALMLPVNLYILLRERGHIDFRGVGWISAARILSIPLGVWLLSSVSSTGLKWLIGISTILAALISLFSPKFTPGRVAYLAAGAVTGVSETATGVGGPPLALVYQHRPAAELRSTLALCFIIGEAFSLGVLLFRGGFTAPPMGLLGGMVAALAVGLVLSGSIAKRVPNHRLRQFVLAFAIVSGVVLLIGA